MTNNWPLWHWHIENSSICSLQCPRCPRSEVPDTLVQTSLNLKFFKRNFDKELLKDVWQISFCGDDGDPIYGKEFLEIVTYLKSHKTDLSLRIITNGSHRPEWWWTKLAKSLNQYDEIHFSIDGWDQESNELYRINSKWDSIITAINTVRKNSPVIMAWASIAFEFNHHKLLDMQQMATDLGFDLFQITKSTKFGSKYTEYLDDGFDKYEPPEDWVAKGYRFERSIEQLTDRTQLDNGKNKINEELWYNIDKSKTIIPMCKIGNKGLYINSMGYFYPCCWMANRYFKTRWQQFHTPSYDLNNKTIREMLADPDWTHFFDNLEENNECISKCSAHNYNKEYATSW